MEERRKRRIRGNRAVGLEGGDFQIKTADLAVELRGISHKARLDGKAYKSSSLLAQPNFFFLDNLRTIKVGQDSLGIAFFLRVWLTSAIKLEKFLNACVPGIDYGAALVHNEVFGLNLFQEVSDFCREVRH